MDKKGMVQGVGLGASRRFPACNLTPCDAAGQPAGLTLEEFITVMRTGADLKDAEFEPPDTPILQVMPWMVYTHMIDYDLQAIYEYLRALPATADCDLGRRTNRGHQKPVSES